jgi:hypothetical protein
MKNCQNRQFQASDGTPFAYPNILSQDGYPQQSPQHFNIVCYIPNIDYGPNPFYGDHCPTIAGSHCSWVVKWTGTMGNLGYGMQITALASSAVIDSDTGTCAWASGGTIYLRKTDCSVTFHFTAGSKLLVVYFLKTGTTTNGVTLTTGNGIANLTDLAIYRKDRETNYNNGEIFDPLYLAYQRALNPRVFRFLGWHNVSNGNRSKFFAETPPTAMTWNVAWWDKRAWVGSLGSPGCTSSDGIAYTAAAPAHYPGGWQGNTDGDFIQCEIGTTNVNTSPMLAVGGYAAVPIVNTMGSGAVAAGNLTAGVLATFTYNKTLNQWFMTSDRQVDIQSSQGGFTKAIPLAIQIELCNQLSKDGWFQIPTLYPVADAAEMGTFVATHLNPPNKAYFEFSNEIFTGPGSTQNSYADHALAAIGFPPTPDGFGGGGKYLWYGMQTKRMFSAIKAAWPSGDDRFNGAQTNQPGPWRQFRTFKLGGKYITLDANDHYCNGSGCTIVYDYSKTVADGGQGRPVDVVTTISIGGYYNPANMPALPLPTEFTPGTPCLLMWLYCPYASLEATPATISNISDANPAVVTVHGGNVASWQNGDRVQFYGAFGIPSLDNTQPSGTFGGYCIVANCGSWTTISNLTSLGGGNYSFTLAASTIATGNATVNNGGKLLTTCVSTGGCPGYTSGGQVARVVLHLNDALLTNAALYATGDPANINTALTWLVNDTFNGTRLNGVDQWTTDYHMNKRGTTGWTYLNAQICATVGFPPLKFMVYEGGFTTFPIQQTNGYVLGLTPTQLTQIRNFWKGFMLADTPGLGQAQDQINTAFADATSNCATSYNGQFLDIDGAAWAVTPSPPNGVGSVNNYGPGVSYGSFASIARWNAGP